MDRRFADVSATARASTVTPGLLIGAAVALAGLLSCSSGEEQRHAKSALDETVYACCSNCGKSTSATIGTFVEKGYIVHDLSRGLVGEGRKCAQCGKYELALKTKCANCAELFSYGEYRCPHCNQTRPLPAPQSVE